MSTIGKICVIVALIAGLAALGLTFLIKPKQLKLKEDLKSTTETLSSSLRRATERPGSPARSLTISFSLSLNCAMTMQSVTKTFRKAFYFINSNKFMSRRAGRKLGELSRCGP